MAKKQHGYLSMQEIMELRRKLHSIPDDFYPAEEGDYRSTQEFRDSFSLDCGHYSCVLDKSFRTCNECGTVWVLLPSGMVQWSGALFATIK